MTDRSQDALEQISLADLDPMDLIAPNFRVYELTASEIASRLRVDNRFPGDRELRAAVNLARRVLQPIRNEFGRLSPNSVFRSQALECVLKNEAARLAQYQSAYRGLRLRHRDSRYEHAGACTMGSGIPTGL